MNAMARSNEHPGSGKGQRKIRNFLLDKRFQLRWALAVVLATAIIVAVMGYFLYRTIGDSTDQILVQKLADPILTKDAINAFFRQADSDKRVTLLILLAGLVSLVLLLGGLTIIYTHKIAGPVYKMRKLIASIDGKNLQLVVKLRRADELQEVFVDFDNMFRRLREHRRDDIKEMEAIRSMFEKGEDKEQAVARLDNLIKMYQSSVAMDK
jgi:nitrate/nitrite-specific signal transduction histidine kinase